jgi:5-methylcytosine-specific restriction endonuclease McrA
MFGSTRLHDVTRFDDSLLVARVGELFARERDDLADFIVYLAEVDRRRLYLDAGCPSIFVWLRDRIRMPKATACRRVTAARLVALIPAVEHVLRAGRVSLVKLCTLRDVLYEANAVALLDRAAPLTEDEVEELALRMPPRPEAAMRRDALRLVPSSERTVFGSTVNPRPGRASNGVPGGTVKRTPARATPAQPGTPNTRDRPTEEPMGSTLKPAPALGTTAPLGSPAKPGPGLGTAELFGSTVKPAPARAVADLLHSSVSPASGAMADLLGSTVKPMPGARRIIALSVGPEFVRLLGEVRATLSHVLSPTASLEVVIGECMRLALAARLREPRATMKRPRQPRDVEAAGREIPAAICRAAWQRDGARCTFIAADGSRCESMVGLELHHRIPLARGGTAAADNLAVVCHAHANRATRAYYEEAAMDRLGT